MAVELSGRAYVFGNNAAYFLKQTYLQSIPEQLSPKKPLTWLRDKKVYCAKTKLMVNRKVVFFHLKGSPSI